MGEAEQTQSSFLSQNKLFHGAGTFSEFYSHTSFKFKLGTFSIWKLFSFLALANYRKLYYTL